MPRARIVAVVATVATLLVGCSTASGAPKPAATASAPAATPTATPVFDLKVMAAGVIVSEHVENGHHMFYNDIALLKLDDGGFLLYAVKHQSGMFDPGPQNFYVAFRSKDGVTFDPAEIPITRPGACNQGTVGIVRTPPGYRMYCGINNEALSRGAPGGFVISAYSTDGINFQLEAGRRLELSDVQPCCPTAVYDLPDGRHRMLFSVDLTKPGQNPNSVIYGATATDWLTWTVDSTSVLGSPSPGNGPQPKVLLRQGKYLMFYDAGGRGISGTRGWLGNSSQTSAIFVAQSDNGLAFTRLWPLGIWGAETAVTLLPDGRISIIYASGCCPESLDAAIGTAQLSVALLTPTG